ncbi:MAG: hypothetical protein A3J67_04230 [Parcubacteria group bacterium RIFCSPHIGHO2_02_FULL_48_10b]|nr:MAG: hypothetical protein A3J67_04230 [Parcubacteria group bacterium RIFCSPHIGHO2_02_FULL_48_10b]
MMLERGSESQKAVPPRSMREATSMELNADLALFAEEDRPLIERYLQGERVAPEEQRRRDLVIQEWWQKKYDFPYKHRAERQGLLGEKYSMSLRNGRGESDSDVMQEEVCFGEALLLVDSVNSQMLVAEQVSSPERMRNIKGSKVNSRSKKRKYLIGQLLIEYDVLPERVQAIVVKTNQGIRLSSNEQSEFDSYVHKRNVLLGFERKKQGEMQKLKGRLRAIDRKEDYTSSERGGRRTLSYDESSGTLFVMKDGNQKVVGEGDVVADYVWGIMYRPDVSVPDHLWRRLRKLSDITEARHRIERSFDEELAEREGTSFGIDHVPVEAIEQNIKVSAGIIAERMMKTFLTRLEYAHPKYGFRIENSNALEDTELKYDFKLVIPQKRRGVAVESEDMMREAYVENKRRVGIQFTITKLNSILFDKERQIGEARKHIAESKYLRYVKRPVDDIVLIRIPLESYGDCFKKWLAAGKPSGGPEQFLTLEEKHKIVKVLLAQNFLQLSDEEIEKLVV